jgi:hypothetical protein
MTGVGVTLYLVLGMHNYLLAALAAGLFAPLIVFHFVITLLSRKNDLISIESTQRANGKLESKMAPLLGN